MATKRISGPQNEDFEDVDPAIDVESEDISDLMNDVDSELDQVTSEFGKDKNDVNLKIKLHRVLERKGEREWLFDILPSELPIMDRVKEEYGGGKYEASLFKNGKLYRKFNFNIANPKIKDVTKSIAGDLNNVVTLLVQQQEKSFSQLKELMINNKPAQSFNMLEMMTTMVTLMSQMKSLMPSPVNGSGNVELLLKGMEIAKDFNGGNGESTMMDVIRDLIKSPLMQKVIEGSSSFVDSNNPNNNKHNLNKIPVQTNMLSKQKPESNLQENNDMNPLIKGYINQLVKKAAQDSDPELYAAFILDNVPETTIRQYILRDDLMEMITKINPQASQYSLWFAELKNNIIEILASEADENLTEPGNSADTADNANESAAKPVDGDTAG